LFETGAVQTQNTIIVGRRGKEHKNLKRKPDRRAEKEKDSSSVLFLTTRVCCVPAAMHDGVHSGRATAKRALIQDTTTLLNKTRTL
jgi:hypothetical protein